LTNPAAVRAKISLASMAVSNANLHFIDRSLQPNVNITLEQLNGTLSGLSSDNPQQAELHLQGAFDKTARAEIRGNINPWNSRQPLELTVALNEMDLLPADPYSGKYLGYRLAKGKLSAQLSYQVSDRQLKSENHLTVHQLTLGQKVESPDATRLPVRLAIAILKDRNGTIALEVPVNGSLDDPQFNLGKVVYRALETVLTRIVTSPFKALGALFGGKDEELSFQEFEPGSTNLLPATLAKLDLLADGLYERPELQVEIEGSSNPVTDLEALRRAELKKQLLAEKWNPAGILFPAETHVAATESRPARRFRKVIASEKGASALLRPWVHGSLLETESKTIENPLPLSSFRPYADDKGATALMLIFAPAAAAADPDWERELLEAVNIAPEALPTLAIERARNVRAYLLQTGKVEAQRITESARGASAKGSRVYLWLQ
jgi:outer membrane protein OmpA-like peptidoglycan-associated protein